ncbi:MAG: hypothetical protein Q7T76_21720 [Ferruginibacter sp.]|nr:hypothetical protein [Ferruginibacter sp.]
MAKNIKLSVENGNLTLSDNGITHRDRHIFRSVKWKIDDPQIESFRIEGKHPGDPFTQRPAPSLGTGEELTVRGDAPYGDWDYSIIWVEANKAGEKTLDPKIAVRPIVAPMFLVVAAVACVSGFLLYKTLHSRKRVAKYKH